MTMVRKWLDEDTNFYFAEIDGMEGQTAIIIDDPELEVNLFCTVEQAEKLAQQLQRYVNKSKLKLL